MPIFLTRLIAFTSPPQSGVIYSVMNQKKPRSYNLGLARIRLGNLLGRSSFFNSVIDLSDDIRAPSSHPFLDHLIPIG